MFNKLKKMETRYEELERQLGDPVVVTDQARYQKIAKEFSDITPLIEQYRFYKETLSQIAELEALIEEKHDDDFEKLAKDELIELKEKSKEQETLLQQLVFPPKVEKDHGLIIEIRAGTGGQEASLFAGDIFRMYAKYAEAKGWRLDPISFSESETGGFKEIIFSITGKGASKYLKWESGVHRVQRVPATEASGRIHTSAATVAVLLEPEDVEVHVDPKDLKIDVFRSSGPGGQSVNTTDSAIRVTHIPTGIVVVCQDERSQLKNKTKAMRVLRARLHDKYQQERLARETQDRKAKVGSGDRSEKIRTYNYPERRVTDHRIGLTLHKLVNIMDGDLDDITEALCKAEEQAEAEVLKK